MYTVFLVLGKLIRFTGSTRPASHERGGREFEIPYVYVYMSNWSLWKVTWAFWFWEI
jgi:hypothetical protein